ncbi:hypothetical protein [Pelagivirga sediminicola]|nr:hypothetical protein [Pelagivirga sediminicola]
MMPNKPARGAANVWAEVQINLLASGLPLLLCAATLLALSAA